MMLDAVRGVMRLPPLGQPAGPPARSSIWTMRWLPIIAQAVAAMTTRWSAATSKAGAGTGGTATAAGALAGLRSTRPSSTTMILMTTAISSETKIAKP